MKERTYIVLDRAGSYEVWESCGDQYCEIFHNMVAESKDQFDAERIAMALTKGKS